MLRHAKSFICKTQKQGLSYVGAVSAYHAHSLRYRLAAHFHQLGIALAESHEAPRPAFHFGFNRASAIVSTIPAPVKHSAVAEADLVLQQKFSFRGLPERHFPRTIDWHVVPDGNLSWSWDLNRHRFFLTLGTAYHYTENAIYRDKLVELWHDWLERNPAGKGLNWVAPFEVAARLRNWMWAYFLLALAPGVSTLFLKKAWGGLRQHAAFLADHLEYHWPNNHLLLEALTLCEFAIVFRGFGGDRYFTHAFKTLEKQVASQVLEDGVHSELCPMYHEIIAGELWAFVLLCQTLEQPLPLAMTERIRAMRSFSLAMRRSDGSFPLLGDSSFPDTCLRFDLAQSVRGDLSYWVNGPELCHKMPDPPPVSLDLFDEAGYAVLRSRARQTHVIFDSGPVSQCLTDHHGHSDALSFELFAAGRPWIVDSGFFYPWKSEVSWGGYFQSAEAHNTLRVSNKEQFEGQEGVNGQIKTRFIRYCTGPEEVSVCGEIQPYGEDGDELHQREVALAQTGDLTLRDLIVVGPMAKRKTCRLQWFFHFAADLSVEITGSAMVLANAGGETLSCEILCDGLLPRLRLVRGQEFPWQGWVAQSSAAVVPAWVLVVEAETSRSREISFRFRIGTSLKEANDQELCVGAPA